MEKRFRKGKSLKGESFGYKERRIWGKVYTTIAAYRGKKLAGDIAESLRQEENLSVRVFKESNLWVLYTQ